MARYMMVMTSELKESVGSQRLSQDAVKALKKEISSSPRVVKRLEQEAPEFYQAMLGARDVHMAKAIDAEAERGSQRIVAVVGVAHLRGMARQLLGMDHGWQLKENL